MTLVDVARPLIRPLLSKDRERENMGWVSSARSFPGRAWAAHDAIPFPLFVIAEDVVSPGKGFGLHGHRDMEIVSYVISGALKHADSRGNGAVLRHGEIQGMTAGHGIRHSEVNASDSLPVHFLQIWILPERRDLAPVYAHAGFDPAAPLTLLAGPDGGLVRVNQAIEIWRIVPDHGGVTFALPPGSRAWAHIVHGPVTIGDMALDAGDGMAIGGCSDLMIHAGRPGAEMLVFVQKSASTGRG